MLPKEDRLIIRSRSSSRRIRYLLCRNQYRFLFRTGRPSDVLTLFVGVTLVRAFMRIKEFLATAAVQPDQQVSAVITVSQGDLIRFEGFQILISLWHGRRRKMMISTHCDLQNASKVACCIYKQLQRMYIFRAVESVTVETCCYCRWSLLFAFVAAAAVPRCESDNHRHRWIPSTRNWFPPFFTHTQDIWSKKRLWNKKRRLGKVTGTSTYRA
jgi:hypothetical protein